MNLLYYVGIGIAASAVMVALYRRAVEYFDEERLLTTALEGAGLSVLCFRRASCENEGWYAEGEAMVGGTIVRFVTVPQSEGRTLLRVTDQLGVSLWSKTLVV
jgi:hypothetical protein